MVPRKEYDPRHAAQRRIAGAIIACVAVLVIAAGVIYIIFRYPNLGLHKPAASPAAAAAAPCRYYSKDVTIDISGVDRPGCAAVLQPLVNSVGGVWTGTTLANGTRYASYRSGARTAVLYDMDGTDTTLAARVAAYLRTHGWT
jgi:hypothetical protein